jgi:hypothetical protein
VLVWEYLHIAGVMKLLGMANELLEVLSENFAVGNTYIMDPECNPLNLFRTGGQ